MKMIRNAIIAYGLLTLAAAAFAQSPVQQPAAPQPAAGGRAPTHGHSVLGEAYNEGPRQHAYLMKGMSNVEFPITTSKSMAQKFFTQGVAQLHGFWYFESERSFRQAAAIDPKCAMAYWGMAMANTNNGTRAREFIKKAVELRDGVSPREQMWIDAEAEFEKPNVKTVDRDKAFLEKLHGIMTTYPNDLEAKAFYGLECYELAGSVPIKDYAALDAIFNEVLAKNPMHPLHHYRIHLWNGRDDAKALNSAALCGPSSPGIAHMWHMQGHTYSSLLRYADAAWSQEAAARVDHAQMNRNRIMPDQVFNYAHNNQWLVEDLGYIGRVNSAIDLACNMIELPRHPSYNTLEGGQSATNGRMRLLQILDDYEMWPDALRLSKAGYLEPGDDAARQIDILRITAVAAQHEHDVAAGAAAKSALEAMKSSHKYSTSGGEKPLPDVLLKNVDAALTELALFDVIDRKDNSAAQKLITDLGDRIPHDLASQLWLMAGNADKAVEAAKAATTGRKAQIEPQGNLVDVLYRAGKKEDAKAQFKALQDMAGYVDSLDLSTVPLFKRLAVDAAGLGLPVDWRTPPPVLKDIGPRPPLESLGPFRWHPVAAPQWSLSDSSGKRVSLSDYTAKGRPVLVVLYLGSGCPACVDQLNALAPMAKEFDAAGISIVAIGVDPRKDLPQTLAQCKSAAGFPFPVLSDKDMKVFKSYRAYDDFEKMPLHGMYLVDGKGLIRWQDIGFKPFMETKFVLDESKRLLKLPEIAQTGVPEGKQETQVSVAADTRR